MTFRTPGRRSIHWATRTHGEPGHLTEFLIDNIDNLVKQGKMKEIGQHVTMYMEDSNLKFMMSHDNDNDNDNE